LRADSIGQPVRLAVQVDGLDHCGQAEFGDPLDGGLIEHRRVFHPVPVGAGVRGQQPSEQFRGASVGGVADGVHAGRQPGQVGGFQPAVGLVGVEGGQPAGVGVVAERQVHAGGATAEGAVEEQLHRVQPPTGGPVQRDMR
jgi:hypothetical protein